MKTSPRALALVAAILAPGLGPPAARSDTIPYTEALISAFNPDESATRGAVQSDPAIASAVAYDRAGAWGSVAALAAADLATGQLKVRAANAPLAGSSPYVQANAWFGDGFRTRGPDGGPFAWVPGAGARFSFDLTGNTASASEPQLGNLGYGQVGAFVILALYEAGTLDPGGKLIGGENNLGYYLYLLGNPNQDLTYTDDQGGHNRLVPSGYYGDLAGDIRITQDIAPGGDFDWAVLIGASGQVDGPEFFDLDLSHTLTVGYAGPAGATTSSVSGLFTNIRAVPEPSSLAMLGGGLAGLGYAGWRRRKAKATA